MLNYFPPKIPQAHHMAYQQAFLQNAVAQNMQIQQQLMMQNQALAHLLQQQQQQQGQVGGGASGPASHVSANMGMDEDNFSKVAVS